MTTTRKLIATFMIGASVFAFPGAASGQEVDVDADVSDGVDANADASVGGVDADADASVGGGVDADASVSAAGAANADADASLGGDGPTASIDANVGDDTNASVSINGDDADAEADLGLLGLLFGGGAAGTGGSGAVGSAGADASNGDVESIVASMSGSDIARYRKPCEEFVSGSGHPRELMELCRMILRK